MALSKAGFRKAIGSEEAERLRRNETDDIVCRFGVISPNRITMHNYPVTNPLTAFNASVSYDPEEESLAVYARIILGYYLYVSSIIEIDVPVNDLFNGYVNVNCYVGRMVLYPSLKYDIWGTEDPRVYRLHGKLFMTYTGRSINYFSPIRENRTCPITAVYDEELRSWVKRLIFTLSEKRFGKIVSNKDAFLHEMPDGRIFLMHRPHLITDTIHLMASKIDSKELIIGGGMEMRRVEVDNGVEVLEKAPFEGKLGWSTPLINLDHDRLVTLVHAVDKDFVVYRVFALQLAFTEDDVVLEAVTPRYIMEPRTPYEVIGDRPLTIFPCGAARIGKDQIVITYGAADYMIGIGIISINNLLAELDRGRIY